MESASCLAAVFHGPGQPLELRQMPLEVPGPGELLVQIELATLCGSDLHTFTGDRQTPCPTILGHEIIGRVSKLPAAALSDMEGRPLAVGDRITWSIAASCGTCFFCEAELPQKCVSLVKYGHEPIREAYGLSGGLAEYCRLAAGTAIVRVPETIPDRVGVVANCATATVAAALRTAGNLHGRCVLIYGAGMLGCTAAAMARTAGASGVVAVDVDDRRLEIVSRFGATGTVKAGPVVAEVVAEETEGRGADVVLELSGVSSAAADAVDQLRVGGQLILVGSVSPSDSIALDPEMVVRRLLTIRGVHNYSPRDLQRAVEFLEAAQADWPLAELVEAEFGLEAVNEAFEHAIHHQSFRVAVRPATA